MMVAKQVKISIKKKTLTFTSSSDAIVATPWTADVSNQSYLKVKQVEGDRSIMTNWALKQEV